MDNVFILNPTFDRNIVFHFNKMHLQDPTVPMWVLKLKGQTYYVNHLKSEIGFSTKETPDNSSTKGSIKFKGTVSIEKINNQLIASIK